MKNENNNLTKRERDCIITVGERRNQSFPTRVSFIAKSLGMKMPTVEEIVKRLVKKGLVQKEAGMVILTAKGNQCYEEIMMKHRAMETFLFECGVDADDACKEVSKFDYLIGKKSVYKIMEKIGKPERCPHGFKIIV